MVQTSARTTSPNFPTGLIPAMINYFDCGWLILDGLDLLVLAFFSAATVLLDYLFALENCSVLSLTLRWHKAN